MFEQFDKESPQPTQVYDRGSWELNESQAMASKYLNRLRVTAIRVLEATSHISTPFIVVFLLVHLSAPASATLGGSSLASQTMVSRID